MIKKFSFLLSPKTWFEYTASLRKLQVFKVRLASLRASFCRVSSN